MKNQNQQSFISKSRLSRSFSRFSLSLLSIFSTVFLLFVFYFLFSASLAIGAQQGLVAGDPNRPGTLCELFQTFQNVLNFLVSPTGGLVFVVAAIGIMVGGTLIMISGGNQQLYGQGVTALKAAVTGLAIALLAWVIVNTVINALAPTPAGEDAPPGFPWPWHEIRCQ